MRPVAGPAESKPLLTRSSRSLYFVCSKNLGGIQCERVQRVSLRMNVDVEIGIVFYDVIFVIKCYRLKCVKLFFFLSFMFA